MQSVTSNQTCGGEQSFTKSCAGSQSFTKSCGEECIICEGCCESIERDSRDHDHMISDENGELWFCEECYSNGNAKETARRNGLLLMGESDSGDDERYQECEGCDTLTSPQERCGHDYCDECVLECCEECREIQAEDCKDDPEGLDTWNLRKTKNFSACIIQRAWRCFVAKRKLNACLTKDDKIYCEAGEHYVNPDEHWSSNEKYSSWGDCMNCSSLKDIQEAQNDELCDSEDEDAESAGSQSFTKSCGVESLSLADFVSIKASDFRDQLVECGTVTYEQMELVSDEKLREAVESSCVLQNYTFTDVWENSTEVLFAVLEELDLPEDVKVSKVTATYDYVGLESLWNIKGDLDNAHNWGIKWDTLHVQWKEGDKYVEYEPNDSASDLFESMGYASQDSEDEFLSSHYDFKRPNNTKLVVEEMTVEEADAECNEP